MSINYREVGIEITPYEKIVISNIPSGFDIPSERFFFLNNLVETYFSVIENEFQLAFEKTPSYLEFTIEAIGLKTKGEERQYIQTKKNSFNFYEIPKSKIGKPVVALTRLQKDIKIKGSEPKLIKEFKANCTTYPCNIRVDIGTHGVVQIDNKDTKECSVSCILGMFTFHFPLSGDVIKKGEDSDEED